MSWASARSPLFFVTIRPDPRWLVRRRSHAPPGYTGAVLHFRRHVRLTPRSAAGGLRWLAPGLWLTAVVAAGPGCAGSERVDDPYEDIRSPRILRDGDSTVPEPESVPPPPRPADPDAFGESDRRGSVDPSADDGAAAGVASTRGRRPAAAPPPSILRPELRGSRRDADPAADDPGPAPARPAEAMVGQIAGQPIYAHRVLEGMEAQLESLGRRLPEPEFRQQAATLIGQQVAGLVSSALIEDAAERALTPQQRQGLDFYIRYIREELLRRYGQGSLALAQRNLMEETGLTLQQTLRNRRTQVMVNAFFDRELKPLINVSRRDIERYYRDNFDTFNPPTKRRVQLIYADSPEDSAFFKDQLESGTPFSDLAADDRNAYGNRAAPLSIESNQAMFGGEIDPAVRALDQGQWAGPLAHRGRQWFIYLQELDQPPRRSLFDAQVDIERELRARQEFTLQQQLERRLMQESTFTDIQQMAAAVLDIAVARYSRPASASR